MFTKYFLKESDVLLSIDHTPEPAAKRLPFRLYECGHFCCGDSYFTEREGLDNFLLIFTLGGKGLIRYRDAESEALPGSCFLIHCKEYQYYRTAPGGFWEFYYIHFGGHSCRYYFETVIQAGFHTVPAGDTKIYKDTMEEIFAVTKKKPELMDIKLSCAITKLLTALAEENHKRKTGKLTRHQQSIGAVRQFMQEHFNENLTIETLAGSIPLSKFYFLKLFRELYGQTPYDYLTGVRINASKRLLKETELSIGEIAEEVGFHDTNNYIRAFKKLTGTTPLQFRLYWVI